MVLPYINMNPPQVYTRIILRGQIWKTYSTWLHNIRRVQRRQWQATPVFLPGISHRWRSLVGWSPWGCEESDTTERLHFHALEKEMATHSSVLAWRIPGMGHPGGLPSMGSHRVGHDWSDSAAAQRQAQVINIKRVPSLSRYTWLLRAELSLNSTIYFPGDFRQVS